MFLTSIVLFHSASFICATDLKELLDEPVAASSNPQPLADTQDPEPIDDLTPPKSAAQRTRRVCFSCLLLLMYLCITGSFPVH